MPVVADQGREPHAMLRQSAIFEGPPALERDIRDWMFSVYAGHVLAYVDGLLIKLRDEGGAYGPVIKQLEQASLQVEEIKGMQGGDVLRFPCPRVTPGGRVTLGFMGVRNTDAGPKESIQWTSGNPYQIGWGARNVSYTDSYRHYEQDEAVVRVTTEIEASLRNARKFAEQAGPPSQEPARLVNLGLLRRECLKYTSRAKSYTTKATATFPVDVTGWRYADKGGPLLRDENEQIESLNTRIDEAVPKGLKDLANAQALYDRALAGDAPTDAEWAKVDITRNLRFWHSQNIQVAIQWGKRPAQAYARIPMALRQYGYKMVPVEDAEKEKLPLLTPGDMVRVLHARGWREISASLYFIQHTERGGQWNGGAKELQVDAVNTQAYNVEVFKAGLQNIASIVRHEVQHVGQDLLRTMALLKEDAGLPSKSVRTPGVNPEGFPSGSGQQEGKQVDHALRDVEFHTDLADAVDKFVHVVRRIPLEARAEAVRAYVGLPSTYALMVPSWEFKAWKKGAPEKWRRAVSEFVKALGARGVKLGGASVRVALRHAPIEDPTW